MTSNTITSCQIARLYALQQELSPMGMTINLELTGVVPSNMDTPVMRKKRKYTKRKKTTAAAPQKDTKAKAGKRSMSVAGSAKIKQASAAYHAEIRTLRDDGLTLKQARAQYKKSKTVAT